MIDYNYYYDLLNETHLNSCEDEGPVVEVEQDVLGVDGGFLRDLSQVGLQQLQSYKSQIKVKRLKAGEWGKTC